MRIIDLDSRCKHDMLTGTCSICLSLTEDIPYATTFTRCCRCGSQISPGDAIVRVREHGRTRLIGECCG